MRGIPLRDWGHFAVKKPSLLLLAFLLVGALGYVAGRARAGGAPVSSPLTYSGRLLDGGVPVDGKKSIELHLWDDAIVSDLSHLKCSTIPAAAIAVNNGHFQLTLDAACTVAIRASADLWIEVRVDGVSLGRSKVGVVPYALEAGGVPFSGVEGVTATTEWPGTVPLARVTPAPIAYAAAFDTTYSAACTLARQNATWIASAAKLGSEAHACSITFTAGLFTTSPFCTCSFGVDPTLALTYGTYAYCQVKATATGAVLSGAPGTSVTALPISLICVPSP